MVSKNEISHNYFFYRNLMRVIVKMAKTGMMDFSTICSEEIDAV